LGARKVEVTVILTATLAANLPANSKVYMSMQLDPAIAAVAQLTVPVNEAWVLEDLFVAASQTPDDILEFVKNLTEIMLRSAPINGCIVTNVARPVPTPTMWEGGDIFTVICQNLAAVGTAAATITAYAKISRFIAA